MRNILIFLGIALAFSQSCAQGASNQPLTTANFMVLGNCGMCEKTIEKAAKAAGAKLADWDKETDNMVIGFDAKTTSADAIQKSIAQAGYDNATYKADDLTYTNLHGCCQYERTGAAGGTKTCSNQ